MISIRLRLVLLFLLLVGAGYVFLVRHWSKSIRPAHLRSMEVAMIDTANVLAALVSSQSTPNQLEVAALDAAVAGAAERQLQAQVYELLKKKVSLRVYVTDANGVVVYDSATPGEVGLDYRAWNDVLRTLRGEYGARSTRADPEDPRSSTIYVAAPILVDGEIAGVLSVGSRVDSVSLFVDAGKRNVVTAAWLVAAIVVILAVVVTMRITVPIRQLTAYAQAIGRGERPPVPQVDKGDMRTLANAFEEMRDELEGKNYVESYVDNLTHELKSPLAAIRANAETLQEADLPDRQRQNFLANVVNETERLQAIVERMLQLAELESRKALETTETVELCALVATAADGIPHHPRQLTVPSKETEVVGDAFLLRHAVANLLQNAVDFTPEDGAITVTLTSDASSVRLIVSDDGVGLPDYALARASERFFSLPRPDSGRKSSGLGLALVAEVAALHGGSFAIANGNTAGAVATITLPRHPPVSQSPSGKA